MLNIVSGLSGSVYCTTPLQRKGIQTLNWQYGKNCDIFSLWHSVNIFAGKDSDQLGSYRRTVVQILIKFW